MIRGNWKFAKYFTLAFVWQTVQFGAFHHLQTDRDQSLNTSFSEDINNGIIPKDCIYIYMCVCVCVYVCLCVCVCWSGPLAYFITLRV